MQSLASHYRFCLFAIVALSLTPTVDAQSLRNPQAPARPFGYQPVSDVYKTGSDARASRFNTNYLPKVMEIVNERFREGGQFQNPEAVPLNVDRMVLNYDYDVRAYFIHEGAGYKNAVGVKLGADHKLLFPDCSYDGVHGVRLQRGDFVELGLVEKGTKLDLLVIPNGGNGGLGGRYYRLYSTPSLSDDKRQHYVGFWIEDTPLLLFGAEDLLGGGDNDFEDVMIVLDFGLDYDPPKTYYVNTNGNDANNGLSTSRPFKTITKAATVVRPGDKVYVAGGTYTENPQFNIAGTDLHPIRFVAQGNVVVQSAAANEWGWRMYYADHYIFDGFRFTGQNMGKSERNYGLYNYHSDVAFRNCEFDNLYYGVHAVYSGTVLQGCHIHDNDGYATLNYYGGLDIKSCEITNNVHGPYSYRDHFFSLKDSVIKDNTGWALLYAFDPYGTHKPLGTNRPTVSNCTIQANANALHMTFGKKDERINFNRTTFEGTTGWEMYLHQCEYDIDAAWRRDWPIEKGGSGLYTNACKLKLKNVGFDDYENGWGFLDYYSDLTMDNVSVKRNANGMQTYAPTKLAAKDCQFNDNKGWGFLLYNHAEGAAAKLSNCTMNGNTHGAHLYRTNESNLHLHNTTIANNTSYGLYLNDCDAEFSPRTMGSRWRLSNNGYGLVTYYGKTLIENITMSDCTAWGAVLHYGEARVRNCNFTGNGNGLWLYHNKVAEAANCHFDDNTTHGLAVAANGTHYGYDTSGETPAWAWMDTPNDAKILNCTMDRNAYGLYMYRTTEDNIHIDNSPIRDNRSAGLYANFSEFDFNPTSINRLFDMTGNAHFIYAGSGKYTFEDLEVADMKGYGIHTWYSDVRMRNCDFKRNPSIAYYGYYDKSFEAKNCTFQQNGWGFYQYNNGKYYNNGFHGGTTGWQDNDGSSRLVNCDISENTHGVGLIHGVDDSLDLVNTPIHDNTHYGLYTAHGEMNFNPETMGRNWDLENNGYHIVAGYGKFRFEDLDFTDAKIGGVSTHYGDVVVKNCKFTDNGSYGFQSYYNRAFMIEDSEVVDNGTVDDNGNRNGTGLHVAHGKYYGYDADDGLGWTWRDTDTVAIVKNTPIRNNGSYGLQIGAGRDDNIRVINSPITDHASAGLYVTNSQFEFTPTTMGSKWQLENNGSHIYASWGTYLFKDLELTGAPSYGAATWGSDVTVKNCKFNENGSYGFHSHYDKLLVENSEFNNNRWAGLTLRNTHPNPEIGGAMTIRNSKIAGNHVGIYMPHCRTDVNPITLENTPVKENSGWGIYFNTCEIDFKPGKFVMDWNLVDNGNNFLIYHGKTRFENATMDGAKGWMAYTAYGDVVAKNSTFNNNGNGIYLHANSQSIVENCTFNDNAGWGVWTRPYYGYDTTDAEGNSRRVEYTGPVKLTNVESLRNANGLGMYDYTVTRDTVELTDVTIAGNTSWGIQFTYLNGELNPETFGQFDRSLKQNGNGVYFNSANADLVGLNISGNSGWGGHSVYSNLTMTDCSFSGNGNGFYWYAGWDQPHMKDITLDVNSSHFDNNTNGQGLLTYWGKATVKNSTFNNNNDGFYTAYDVRATVENCEMKGNRRWGVVLHVNYADWSTSWLDDRKSWYQDNVQTLKDCTIDGNSNGLLVYNAKNEHFSMQNVDITNTNGGHGLYFAECQYLWDSQQADDVTIDGCGYGITVTGATQGNVTLKDVTVNNCTQMGLYAHSSQVRAENVNVNGGLHGAYWYRPKRVDIINSRFDGHRQSEWGWAAHGYGGPTEGAASTVTITNSVFNNYRNGVYTYAYGDEASPPSQTIYNNTFANLGFWGAYADRSSKPDVKNNIFSRKPGDVGGYGLAQHRNAGGSLVHSHNLLSGFAASFYDGVTDPDDTTLLNEPRFTDEANGDFRLAKGSPAINSGTDLSAYVPYDMEGNARPAYKVFEIGAYEFTDKAGSFRILDWNEKK